MNILTINCGSSSIKAAVFAIDTTGSEALVQGAIERIGEDALISVARSAHPPAESSVSAADHRTAARALLDALRVRDLSVEGVGHRIVQGGAYTQPALIDDEVMRSIDAARRLAPLHNGPSVDGIMAARDYLPDIPMAAVFDTAFHSTMPARASHYALPHQLALKYGLHRHGYHGLAHRSMTERFADLNNKQMEDVSLITLQLGNGCSATAISAGRSVDTSMGFTPLEGLVMGTRVGDIDAGAITYLLREGTWSPDELERLLNHDAGLLGISGASADMSTLLKEEEDGHPRAREAVDLFCYRALKYIGSYIAILGRLDAIVFGGGIGERSPEIRRRICEPLEPLGLAIDRERNQALTGGEGLFNTEGSRFSAWVIPSDEERVIARDTFELLSAHGERDHPSRRQR